MNPSQLSQYDGRNTGGIDNIIAQSPQYQQAEAQRQQQERENYYAGLSADSPPVNRTFGAVGQLEKTDLQFLFMAVQTLLLLLIYLEVR